MALEFQILSVQIVQRGFALGMSELLLTAGFGQRYLFVQILGRAFGQFWILARFAQSQSCSEIFIIIPRVVVHGSIPKVFSVHSILSVPFKKAYYALI